MQVKSAHARHAVALSTRRMRSNKIEFLPVEDEFMRKKMAKDKEIKALEHQESLQKAILKDFIEEKKTRKTLTTSNPF